VVDELAPERHLSVNDIITLMTPLVSHSYPTRDAIDKREERGVVFFRNHPSPLPFFPLFDITRRYALMISFVISWCKVLIGTLCGVDDESCYV